MVCWRRCTNRALKTHWPRLSTYRPSLEALEDRTVPTTLTLKFNSLPSAQGWTYLTGSPPISETRAYSVDGTKLTQNTIGIGSNFANYAIYNAVDPTQPFTIDVRARVLQSEDTQPGGSVTAFFAGAFTGTELFGFFLNTSAIRAPAGTQEVASLDATQFHEYRVEAKPGVNVSIYVDNVLFVSEPPPQNNSPNQVELGNASSFENGLAEITSFTLTQGQPNIVATSLTWHTDHSNPADAGGVDFTYQVLGQVPNTIPIAVYWARGATFADVLPDKNTPAYTVPINNAVGTHTLRVTASQLGMPPLQATIADIIVKLDPFDQLATSPETDRLKSLPASARDIVGNSITAVGVGTPEITAKFSPARGALTLKQAEAICGVNHFNWLQTITPPSSPTWFVKIGPSANQLAPASVPFDDPIVRPVGSQLSNFIIVPGVYSKPVRLDVNFADQYRFYLDEILNPDTGTIEWQQLGVAGGTQDDFTFVFRDSPDLPKPDLALSPYGSSGWMFTTQLVGIDSNHQIVPNALSGATRITITWSDDRIFDTSGGIEYIGITKPVPGFNPPGISGGVISIQIGVGTIPEAPKVNCVTITPIAGAPFSGIVASFTDADGGTLSDYSAKLDWGDGTATSGIIAANGVGGFNVLGSHTYASPGPYSITVEIDDKDGTIGTAGCAFTVPSLGLSVQHGQSAGIGFWHNNNGQALIDNFNGGPNATALSSWLASSFPNLYGTSAGVNNLTGKTNAQVAALYLTDFSEQGPKLDAEVLATALNVYATTLSLGGSAAQSYGFTVNAYGLGADWFNVGGNGGAFGVANNTTLNVYQLLLAANKASVGGVLYNGNQTLRSEAVNVFDAINSAGGN